MRRTVFAALMIVLTAGFVPAQEKKDDKKPVNLYPLTKGTKWEYELVVGAQKMELVQEVTDIAEPKEKGGRAVATLSSNVAGTKVTEEMSSDDKGVYKHALNGQKLETPFSAVKYPIKAGTKWTETISIQGQSAELNFEVKEAEKVKVAAGEYTAYPVDMVVKVMGQTVNSTSWHADGVGIVKQEMKLGGMTVTSELKKFNAGK
jgi:hypothetical protein